MPDTCLRGNTSVLFRAFSDFHDKPKHDHLHHGKPLTSDDSYQSLEQLSDESARIQFLQDEPYCFDAHQVKDKKGNWVIVPCQLNTGKHCVLCSEGVKQTWRAAFKILDFRGTWDKDKKCFRNDKAIEKIWKVGSTIAQQLKQIVDKKGKDLTEMVFEVTRSGSGKDSSYNFEQAFDDDDRKVKPIEWDEQTPSAEDLCQPPTEDEIDEAGYTDSDD